MQGQELRTLAQAVAPHLPGFKFRQEDEIDHYATLANADGAEIILNGSQAGNGKVHVSGHYPKDKGRYMAPRDWGAVDYKSEPPSINVSASRLPEAIARDIARRFLPDYLTIYAACLKRQQERDGYRSEQRAAVERIAAALDSKDVNDRDDLSPSVSFYSDEGGYGDFSPNSVKLNSLPLAAVLEIASVVRKYASQGDK